MPREIVLGNGELLVNLDGNLFVRDIYWPYVGWANHVGGYRCRVGIWVADGGLTWLDDEGWERQVAYAEDTLVTDCTLRHQGHKLRLHVAQAVLHDANVFLQRFTVENTADTAREVRLFFAHDLRIDESDIGDTAFYHPWHQAMIHYKRDRYFLFGGVNDAGEGIRQYACGEKGFRGAEGTWRDAEDGLLSMNAIAQGSVDSVVSYRLTLSAQTEGTLRVWMTAHESLEEAAALQDTLRTRGFDAALSETDLHWRGISAPPRIGGREAGLDRLPPRVAQMFSRSLLVIRTQVDKRGAILASNDSDIMETARAHYSYMWPRDGALVSYALDKAGLRDMTLPFFEFCARVLPKDRAALMHKYGPDGTIGASWHPWVIDGSPEVPFQEDGTALVLWSLWHHYQTYQDKDFLASMYRRFVRPAAEFLTGFRDTRTGLPLPSWDLWEERHGAHIWTTATVVAALDAAAEMARLTTDAAAAETFSRAAQEIKEALLRHFWDEDAGRFARMVTMNADGEPVRDLTVDSSAYAVFGFGILSAADPKVVATMQAMGRHLWVKTGTGGLARYERDYYFRISDDFEKVPGNPWIICTLWLADWYIATAKSPMEMRSALDLLEWAVLCASRTGILSEQVHPFTMQPLSVAPLTWSHSQFVLTVSNYLDKLAVLSRV